MRRTWERVWWGLVTAFLVFEGFSLLDGNPATPPLTEVLVDRVPAEVLLTILGWAGLHFGIRYARKALVRLRGGRQ